MKNITKRLVVMLLLVATVVGVLPASAVKAATKKNGFFNDVTAKTTGYEEIKFLAEIGAFGKNPSGKFNPSSKVTQKEVLSWLAGAYKYQHYQKNNSSMVPVFTLDNAKGFIITEEEYKKLNQKAKVTRYDMAKYVTRTLKHFTGLWNGDNTTIKTITNIEKRINDFSKCKTKEQQYNVKVAYSYGIISGSKFNGNSTLTKAAAAIMVARIADPKYRVAVNVGGVTVTGQDYVKVNRFICYNSIYDIAKNKKAITGVLEAAGVKDSQSELEKYARILKWVDSNINYYHDYEESVSGVSRYEVVPYKVIKNKKVVCMGFASLTKALCVWAGLDADTVVNTTHMWNIVKIDGEWWYSDPTNCRGTHMLDVLSSCTPDEKAETKEAMEYAIKKFGGKIKTMKSNFCVWEMNTSGLPIKGADYMCWYKKADEYCTIKYCFYGKDPITVTYQTEDDYDKAFDDDDDDDELWDFDDENIVYLDESEYALYFN